MATSTLFHNSQKLVVGIGSAPATGPWLQQMTYLIDQFGHTTAVLVDQPTVVSTITPAPYTAQAQEALPFTGTSSQTALSSTVRGGLPSVWEYKGCYIDDPNARVLPMRLPDDPILTAQECVSSCYQLGYSVAGLEYRRECFCGNAIYNGGTIAPSQSDCNLTCAGNAMEVCGARNRLSTYSNREVKIYQPEVVQTSRPATTTPTVAPSPTGSTSRTPKLAVTVAAAVIGVAAGIAIMVALLYLCWRIRNNRQNKSPLQRLQVDAQAWPPADPVPSWEYFLKATEEHYAKYDESTMLSREGGRSGLGPRSTHVEHRPGIPELRERYELQLNNQRMYRAGSKSSDMYAAPPSGYSPPTRLAVQGHVCQPTSILKRPTTPGITNMAQGTLELEDRQVPRDLPATGNLARAKKGVRFGVSQIREFGRSPFIGHGGDSSVSSR